MKGSDTIKRSAKLFNSDHRGNGRKVDNERVKEEMANDDANSRQSSQESSSLKRK